jgi:DNA repair photolyase
MKIREIQAKTLLSKSKEADPFFDILYTMNLYRGCSHRCIYCDSRSECYQIEHFDEEILVKANALALLSKELSPRRQKGRVGTGSMNDPYQAVERKYRLTRQALTIIAQRYFPVHIITKSDLVTRDTDILQDIQREGALVSFTLTTVDDELAGKLEPYAPPPSRRLQAMRQLSQAGIAVGVTMMPILPWIEDTPENVSAVIHQSMAHGAQYILPWMGMSLRTRQREYYYDRLEEHFPGLAQQYQQHFGYQYQAATPNAQALYELYNRLRETLGFADHVPVYRQADNAHQPSLFAG